MDDQLCPLCTHSNSRPLKALTERSRSPFSGNIVQCTDCGLARFFPLPSEDELAEYYSGNKYLQGFADAEISAVTENPQTLPFLVDRLEQLAKLIGQPGQILDVGASTGTFLSLARDQGWKIEGLEMSESTIELADSRHGIKLTNASIEKAPFPDATFDVVHASHVLEHVRDPNLFLQQCFRLLKSGGILCVEVPSELGDLFTAFQRVLMMRRQPPNRVPSPHLYFFTPRTLQKIAVSQGFQVHLVTTPRRNGDDESRYPLGHIVKKALCKLEWAFHQGPLIELFARKTISNDN